MILQHEPQKVELRYRLRLTKTPAKLVQKRLRQFGHVARRLEGELISEPLLPAPPRSWRTRTGGQLKTWTTTIKACVEPLSGPQAFDYTGWRKDWVKVSSEPGVPPTGMWSTHPG